MTMSLFKNSENKIAEEKRNGFSRRQVSGEDCKFF